MKLFFKPILLAGVLATTGFSAFSQAPARGDCAGMMGAGAPMHEGIGHHRMGGRLDPAKMQAWIDKRNAALKAQLKLTAAQDGVWTTYTGAMKPFAGMVAKGADFAELAKLPTPERIDKIKALRTQHLSDVNAAMDKRGEATKALYAALTPEQQKLFDANAMRYSGQYGRQHGPHDGKRPTKSAQ